MARLFQTPIDLGKLELQNARIQNLSATSIGNISSPVSGQFVYDSTNNVLKYYNGTGWAPVGGVSTGSGAPGSAPTTVGALYLDTTNYVLYASKGTSSAADWVPALPYGTSGDMAALGSADSAGTSVKVSRADHVHRHTNADHGSVNLSALAAAAADISLGGYKITNVATPTSSSDAANKGYVDSAVVGIDWKPSVRVATTENLTTLSGFLTIDGVTLVDGNRVLVKNQETGADNGIYVAASGSWARSTDADSGTEVTASFAVFVEEGTTNADSGWTLTNNGTVTVGSTALVFTQFTGLGQITAGAGLTKTGNTLDVGTASSSRIVVNANDIDLASVSQTNTSGSATKTFVTGVTVDSYGRVTGQATADVQDATTSTKGIASFDSDTFSVTSGAVDVKSGGITNTQLANSSITVTGGTNISVSTSPVSLGGSTTIAITGEVAVTNGGTGASTAAGARANLGATTKVSGTNSAGTSTVINHALGQWVLVQLFDTTTGLQVEADVTNAATDGGTTTITFATSQSAGAYTYVIIG